MDKKRLAILAGGGDLPALLAESAAHKGYSVDFITFKGQPQPKLKKRPESEFPPETFPIGSVGEILEWLKFRRITHVVLAGHLNRPSLFSLKMDWIAYKLLLSIRSFSDDVLLKLITTFLEKEGFKVLRVRDLAASLLAPEGLLTKHKPSASDKENIELARLMLHSLSSHDIGQSLVMYQKSILGIEAVEGTDELLRRCAKLRGSSEGRGGILVKFAKYGQTEKADLPTVGPGTIALLKKYRYSGLAIQAHKTILLGQDKFVREADKAGLFVIGL